MSTLNIARSVSVLFYCGCKTVLSYSRVLVIVYMCRIPKTWVQVLMMKDRHRRCHKKYLWIRIYRIIQKGLKDSWERVVEKIIKNQRTFLSCHFGNVVKASLVVNTVVNFKQCRREHGHCTLDLDSPPPPPTHSDNLMSWQQKNQKGCFWHHSKIWKPCHH